MRNEIWIKSSKYVAKFWGKIIAENWESADDLYFFNIVRLSEKT